MHFATPNGFAALGEDDTEDLPSSVHSHPKDADGKPVTTPQSFKVPPTHSPQNKVDVKVKRHTKTGASPFPTLHSPQTRHSALTASLLGGENNPIRPDSGCSGILIPISMFPGIEHLFTPKVLPPLIFSLPDGSELEVGGEGDMPGTLSFPHHPNPFDV